MGLEAFLVLALILANGLFSMSEMAVVAARKSRLQEQADRGSRAAQSALNLANSPTDFFSTVQIGITVVGTLASAVGGATIAARMSGYFNQYAFIAPHGETVSLALVVVVLSYVSLILGELVPKRLALRAPERVSTIVAPILSAISVFARPLVRFLSWSTELVLRLIPTRPSTEAEVTEEEIKGLIDQAVDTGTMQHAEREMLQGVFWLGDRRVNQIMTPRNRVVWLDVTASPEENLQTIEASHFTTFPVADGSLDHIIGMVDVKLLLPGALRTQSLDLRSSSKPPLLVPETIPAVRLISMFQQSQNHMAIAIDEHGNAQGIVTLTDILETIVGDIPAPGQAEPPSAVKRADGSWLVDGIMPLVELKDLMKDPRIPEPSDVTTVAGIVMMEAGRIPAVGDSVNIASFRWEVVDMDGARVDKVLIQPQNKETTEANASSGNDGHR